VVLLGEHALGVGDLAVPSLGEVAHEHLPGDLLEGVHDVEVLLGRSLETQRDRVLPHERLRLLSSDFSPG
jgi:hypothetical protein